MIQQLGTQKGKKKNHISYSTATDLMHFGKFAGPNESGNISYHLSGK